jgi:hypothetical protein
MVGCILKKLLSYNRLRSANTHLIDERSSDGHD